MLVSTLTIPLTSVDAGSPTTGRSSSIDTDQDGFLDTQDACPTSLQNWTKTNPLPTSLDWDVSDNFEFLIDSKDQQHIAYFDRSNDSLHYLLINGTNISSILLDSGNQSGNFLSMVLDSNEHPKILYSQQSSTSYMTLNLAEWNGTNWKITDSAAVGALSMSDYGYYAKISLNSNDDIFISYLTGITSNSNSAAGYLLVLSQLNGSDVWVENYSRGVFNVISDGKYTLSITTDNLGSPIVYLSGDIYANESGVWDYLTVLSKPTGVVGPYPNNLSRSEIQVDASGYIHLIAQTHLGSPNNQDNSVTYAVLSNLDFTNSTFNITTEFDSYFDYSTKHHFGGGSLILDSNGVSHTSFGADLGASSGPHYVTAGVYNTTVSEYAPGRSIIQLDSNDRPYIAFNKGGWFENSSWKEGHIASRTGGPTYLHSDNDGCDDVEDSHPNDSTQWIDYDGDGYGDNLSGNNPDLYPNDSTQWNDTDGDGYGDNLTGNNPDEFPNDSTQWNDTDGDGYGDNLTGNNPDLYPNDSTQWNDTDGDGYGDNLTGNNPDEFPNDSTQWNDTDGDGYGDNLTGNYPDLYPNDSTQWNDTDGDGYGDNLTGNNPDEFPNDSTQWNDTDGDGYGDNLTGNYPDLYPNDSTQWNDTDGDGYGDNLNGINGDKFPLDSTEWLDFDSDGLGDNSDADDDNDGYNDSIDVWPFDNCTWFDRDLDGKPNVILQGCTTSLVEDGDDDGDTKLDQDDFCPFGEIDWLSGTVTDHDADGCRDDGEDVDDDNDGLNDTIDLCPRGYVGWVSNPSADADSDGCHDSIEDNDDDNDGVSEPGDQCPNTPIGVSVDAQGCPLDSDGDGVADYLDNCSNTPSGVIVDSSGCPIDSDGDGTPDYQDGFPNDANETADSDGDGVGDNSDSFPNDANETADSDGDGVGDNSDECQSSDPLDEVENDGCVLQAATSETSSLVNPTSIGVSIGIILLVLLVVVLIRRTGDGVEEQILFEEGAPSSMNTPLETNHSPRTTVLDISPPQSEIGVLGDDGYYWLEWPSASDSWYYREPSEQTWNYFEK